jgi:hypothetical protein
MQINETCKQIQNLVFQETGILVDESQIQAAIIAPTREMNLQNKPLGLVPVKQKWSKKWKK